ncbi:MAG: guanylate kinase [Enterococcus sp.]|nr:guanylate kinase [Enterococcus sp.]
MKKGKLFVISGPSGVGKGTICNLILTRRKNTKLSISATTRAPREGELDGVNYFFKDKSEFEKMITNDEMLEFADVFGNYYGTPKNPVIASLNAGEDVLLEIDVQGALQVKKNYKDAILIFILPPSLDELEKRLRGRGTDSPSVIEKRLNTARGEIRLADKYDYRITNDKLKTAVKSVLNIMDNA